MGVGTYGSDYDGAGSSLLVSGPLGSEQDYAAYVAGYEADSPDDEPMDLEEWSTEQYDDFNLAMIETIESAARELGFGISDRRGFVADRAGFDSELVSIASNDVVEIGWRSWEHDYVVGIAGDGQWQEWMGYGGAADEYVATYGLDPSKSKADYLLLVDAVEEYVRIALQQVGIECRYRTSSYTSSAYDLPEDPEARRTELKEFIAAKTRHLEMPLAERALVATPQQRIEMVKAVQELGIQDSVDVFVPLLDLENGGASCWNAFTGEVLIATMFPQEMAAAIENVIANDGLRPIPRDERTEAWFQSFLSKRRPGSPATLLTVDEYVQAFEEPFVAIYEDEGRKVEIEFGAPAAPAPAA